MQSLNTIAISPPQSCAQRFLSYRNFVLLHSASNNVVCVSFLIDHTLFALFSSLKDKIFHSYFLQDTTRTVNARTRVLPAQSA